MNKIYIVIQSLWEDWEIKEVYNSLEKVEDYIKKVIEYYKSLNNTEYEYIVIEQNKEYEIRRVKKYDFADGLVNDVLIDNFTIIEKEVK